jgi:hypothetical protein
MHILALRSYGDYVILLNSIKHADLKQDVKIITSNHLKPLHEALNANFSTNFEFIFKDFGIKNGLMAFFTNKYLTINIITGLSFVLSGYFTFVFSKKILNSFFLAFLTGFIFSFQPFIQSRLYVGHYNLILTFTIPLFLINLFNFFFKNNKWLT